MGKRRSTDYSASQRDEGLAVHGLSLLCTPLPLSAGHCSGIGDLISDLGHSLVFSFRLHAIRCQPYSPTKCGRHIDGDCLASRTQVRLAGLGELKAQCRAIAMLSCLRLPERGRFSFGLLPSAGLLLEIDLGQLAAAQLSGQIRRLRSRSHKWGR